MTSSPSSLIPHPSSLIPPPLMRSEEFESLVEEALDSLPEQFASLLHNIAIVVEEEPSDDDLDVLEDDDAELLGIYRGTPMTERSYDMVLMPDQIAIFRGPILRVARTRREAVREIRETVIHELGHYFGLGDDDMVF
jgi:predicted Zn-dependent protease with MMP-like domain